MDQGSGDGADDDSYQHNGGDDENHETLAGLGLECLLFHRVYLAIALEGMDGIHENSVAVSVARGGDVNQRRCNMDIQFNIWFLGALESSPTFSLFYIFFFSPFSPFIFSLPFFLLFLWFSLLLLSSSLVALTFFLFGLLSYPLFLPFSFCFFFLLYGLSSKKLPTSHVLSIKTWECGCGGHNVPHYIFFILSFFEFFFL